MDSSKIFFEIMEWFGHSLYVFFCWWSTKHILNRQDYQKTSKKIVIKQALFAACFFLVMLIAFYFRIDSSDRTEDGEPLDLYSYRIFIIKISIIGCISSIASIYIFNSELRMKNRKYKQKKVLF